jgi:dTMP kinase
MQGHFIAVEGTDGSGKGTQTELLVNRLKQEGHDVEVISFPRYGQPSCALVEYYLNGKLGGLQDISPYKGSIFYAIDRYVASFKIRSWILENKIVICNRYVGSNMGHQGGKIKDMEERQKYFDWNYDLEYNIFGIPKPDINIVLHVTPEISQHLVDKKASREYLNGKKRDIHEDNLNHLRDAEASYIQMTKSFSEFRLIECVENDQLLSVEVIQSKIYTLLKEELKLVG